MRFEFLELLLRIAVAKYLMNDEPCRSVGEAFTKLMEVNLLANLDPHALVDKDTFRRERLYTYV